MTRGDISAGVFLRVIAPRWDRPPGTLAKVTKTGHHHLGGQWWFTVEWLTKIGKEYPGSLRIGEEELSTFEMVTESAALPADREDRRPALAPWLSQIPLPFTADDE